MWKNRVLWICLTVAAAALYLFGNSAATFAVLMAAIFAPVLSIASAFLFLRGVKASLELPQSCAAGDTVEARLELSGGRLMPSVDCTLAVENVYTGERIERELTATNDDAVIKLTPSHCGLVRVSMAAVRLRDPLGLVRLRARASAEREILVEPRRFEMRITLADDVDSTAESDEYSMTKPGGDPSETFGVREYQPGDPIKQIHWKLSQKSQNLMLRELGLPIVRRALVLLETTFPEGENPRPEPLHAAAEVFFSVSAALCEQETAHVAAWRRGETLVCREIATVEDVVAAAAEWLSEPTREGGASIAELYAETFERCGYAHVAVISPCAPRGVELLYGGNRVTALCPYGGAGLEGVHLCVFSDKNYAAELREWEF